MIKSLNDDDYILNINNLGLDIEQRYFAKISAITPKKTTHGDLYLSICFKDRFGRPIYGNLFHPYVEKYADCWENFVGEVVVIRCVPQKLNNNTSATLNVIGIIKPDIEEQKVIKDILFEGVIDNLAHYKENIESLKSGNEKLNKLYQAVLQIKNYKEVAYVSEFDLLDAKNGVYYVLYSNTLDALRSYAFLTDEDIQKMMFALILVNSTMLALNKKNAFDYKVNVIVNVNSLLKSIGISGDLYNICIGYLNIVISDESQITRLSSILDTTFNTVKEVYKFNNLFNSISKGTVISIANTSIKND
jgi:hypothetical protein